MNQSQKSKVVRQWMADNQGQHVCECGCGGFIVIKIHHHTRGIPQFINGHVSRVANPMKGRIGDLNPHYKAGRYVCQAGYVCVLVPGPGRSHYVRENRLVMEQHLGRPLRADEDVHHKNGNKTDNRIENLELLTRAAHSSLHARAGEIGFGLQKKQGKKWWKKRSEKAAS